MRIQIAAALAAMLASAPASAGLEFDLKNDCDGVELDVNVQEKPKGASQVSEKDIETAVRSILREAGIYRDKRTGDSVLVYAGIHLLKDEQDDFVIYTVEMLGSRYFRETATAGTGGGVAETWGRRVLGIKSGNHKGYILQTLRELTDRFVDEYLSVNRWAC